MQLIVQRRRIVVGIHVVEAEMLAGEVGIKLLDGSTAQHLIHVPWATVFQYLVPTDGGTETVGLERDFNTS